MGDKKAVQPKINMDEFLCYCHAAYKRDRVGALFQLSSRYPELSDQFVEDILRLDKRASCDSDPYCPHPVVSGDSRMTERQVLDMVAYLLCRKRAPKEYKAHLQKAKVSSREDFNIRLNRYQKDYDRDDLWEKYFLHLPELRQIIQQRRIGSLTELAYRAAEYFERYTYEIEPI